MGRPSSLKESIVITEIKGGRGGGLRSELELDHVRRPRLEPDAVVVLVAAVEEKQYFFLQND